MTDSTALARTPPDTLGAAPDGLGAAPDGLGAASTALADKAVDKVLATAPEAVKTAAKQLLAPWVEKYVRVLDDAIRIPGTPIGIGLDSVVGFLLPGAGDVATGIGSIALLFVALRERVPTIVLLRMVLNILVDTAGGFVPVVGDLFDVFWRSNRRNLDLIERFRNNPKEKPTPVDYAIVVGGVGLAILSAVLPILIIYVVGAAALTGLGALLAHIFG